MVELAIKKTLRIKECKVENINIPRNVPIIIS